MKRAAAIAVALLFIVGGAVFAFLEYRARQLPDVAPGIVKNATLRLNDSLSYEVQPSNTTYGELLEKLQKNIGEIDSKIIDLQSVETPKCQPKTKPLLDYLHGSLDVLRAQSMANRKDMELKSALERTREAYRDYMQASGYSTEYERKSFESARESLVKQTDEYREAHRTLKASLAKLLKARAAALQILPAADFCDPQLVVKVDQRADKDLQALDALAKGQ